MNRAELEAHIHSGEVCSGLTLLDDYAGANLGGGIFEKCIFTGARFEGARLKEALFVDCALEGATLAGADCHHTLFHRGQLAEANFSACATALSW